MALHGGYKPTKISVGSIICSKPRGKKNIKKSLNLGNDLTSRDRGQKTEVFKLEENGWGSEISWKACMAGLLFVGSASQFLVVSHKFHTPNSSEIHGVWLRWLHWISTVGCLVIEINRNHKIEFDIFVSTSTTKMFLRCRKHVCKTCPAKTATVRWNSADPAQEANPPNVIWLPSGHVI